jgi:type I restriction enzyme R subunit
LDEALETVRALCEPVQPPKGSAEYIRYFCGDTENPYALKENEIKRVRLYKSVSRLLRVYADIANDMKEAGYSEDQKQAIVREVEHYEKVRTEVKLASGDYIDLKKYEPAMRALMDRYISASESEKLTAFDDKSLVELMAEKGVDAIDGLPALVKQSEEAVAETIENNVRKLITDEMPTNPKYYQRMSELLDELVKKRKQADLEYRKYLEEIIALSKQVKNPSESGVYPNEIDTRGKQALYDNLGKDQAKAESIHDAIMSSRSDDWRGHPLKERKIRLAIQKVLPKITDQEMKDLFEIIKNQNEY